ncbi:MAG: endolytic transglycosylase MltG [Pseudomonadota bacterium]
MATALIALAGAAWWLIQQLDDFEQQPLSVGHHATLWLPPGSSYTRLVNELERLGMTGNHWRWRWWGRLRAPVLQAGEYRVEPGVTAQGLFSQIAAGQVMTHRFTIIEGWTTERLRSELEAESRLESATAAWTDDELMTALGCVDCFAEGRFLPETYFFSRGDRDYDVLKRAFDDMQDVLERAWQLRATDLPIQSTNELLVLASLVEMETTDPSELAEVSGVFKRRLQAGMRLQTDPTVVYGIEGPFDGRIRRVHLQTDHPWNTYTRHGLPPTPIAMPGQAAIEAAAQPAAGDTFYFVARGDGTHQFSRTLDEHNRAVNRYIRGRH